MDDNILTSEEEKNLFFVGRLKGVSVKIANGVYYRMGAYSGESKTPTDIKLITSGITFLTSKIFFSVQPIKTVKIPFNKIISITACLDGTCIQKDDVSTKPFILTNIDAGFIQNIIAVTTK